MLQCIKNLMVSSCSAYPLSLAISNHGGEMTLTTEIYLYLTFSEGTCSKFFLSPRHGSLVKYLNSKSDRILSHAIVFSVPTFFSHMKFWDHHAINYQDIADVPHVPMGDIFVNIPLPYPKPKPSNRPTWSLGRG